ncbi:hypothetical protein E3Q13_04491 [Wallemia mellicola]|nr:hypothetical protein E3Q13_04491 [Wallemia mellicola]
MSTLRYKLAEEEMKLSQSRSTSDPYIPLPRRTIYAEKLLSSLPADIDLDSYNMTVYPSELLTLFSESTSVSLVSHKPNIRDVEEYDDWVYAGQSIG